MKHQMENIEIVEIKVVVLPGSDIEDCIRNAIELSMKEWIPVSLIHNERKYLIKPRELISFVFNLN